MRVYNLTNKEFLFRKQSIPPGGGYRDYPELDSGIPEIDRPLVESKMLSFGSLPPSWNKRSKVSKKATSELVVQTESEDIPEIADPSVIQEVPVESRLSKKALRALRRGKRDEQHNTD